MGNRIEPGAVQTLECSRRENICFAYPRYRTRILHLVCQFLSLELTSLLSSPVASSANQDRNFWAAIAPCHNSIARTTYYTTEVARESPGTDVKATVWLAFGLPQNSLCPDSRVKLHHLRSRNSRWLQPITKPLLHRRSSSRSI